MKAPPYAGSRSKARQAVALLGVVEESSPGPSKASSEEQLNAILAERVMGWRVAPDRFVIGGRRWLPRWRFAPTSNIGDAFQLLDAATLVDYDLHADRNGLHTAKLRTSGASVEASCSSMPRAICLAIARAYGIDVETPQ
jgi:hypothetical protein